MEHDRITVEPTKEGAVENSSWDTGWEERVKETGKFRAIEI